MISGSLGVINIHLGLITLHSLLIILTVIAIGCIVSGYIMYHHSKFKRLGAILALIGFFQLIAEINIFLS